VHVQRWNAREQQHQDLARRLLRALSLVRPYVPVAIWNTTRSDFDSQREQPSEPQRGGQVSESGEPQSEPQSEPQRGGHVSEPCESQSHVSEPCGTAEREYREPGELQCEPQRGGRSVEPPAVALAVVPGALPAAAAAGLSERATAAAVVASAEEPAAVQLPVRPSHVPRYYVQDWSTGEWMPWRLLQQRLDARRELQRAQQRPRGTRVRGCRAGRRGRSRRAGARSDANCFGGSCESALSSEEQEAECQVLAAMRSVA
jgi:hypothetical protein